MYNLYLDDVRDPPAAVFGKAWIVCRSSAEAIDCVLKFGAPAFMSLDHDLGGEDTSMVFLKWLAMNVENVPGWTIHSANPVGKDNIYSFMSSWERSLKME